MTKKNKIILSLACISCSILLVIGLTFAFVINFNKLSPEFVTLEESNSTVFLKTEANNNYFGYRFKFYDAKNEILIDSSEPLLDITNSSQLTVGVTYKVSACFLGENEGGNSAYSENIEYNHVAFLEQPNVTKSENELVWRQVNNADYYVINCMGETLTSVTTQDIKCDFSKLPVGNLEIRVQAFSNNENYKPSFISNIINLKNVHNFKAFTGGSVDYEKLEILLIGPELLTKIDVKINSIVYQFTNFEVGRVQNSYQYTLDIRAIFEQKAQISVAPSSLNEFYVYNGNFLEIG